jgi:hypothetical protein
MPIQVSAEVPGECFPGPECTRLTSRTPRAPGGGWRRAPPRTDHMDWGNDALGEAPMVLSYAGPLLLALAFALQFIAWWRS